MSIGVQTTLNGLNNNDEQHSLNVEMAHLGHFPKMKNRTQWNPLQSLWFKDLHEAPPKQWRQKEEDTQGRMSSHKGSKTLVVV